MRAVTARAAGCIVVLAGAAMLPAAAAPGGDALLETSTFVVDDTETPAASAVVMCPAGTRATGGGVAPLSPVPADNYRVQLSGPVDSTGAAVTTDTGDVPRGWAATVSHFGAFPDESFKIFVLCSRNSDAVIQAAAASGSGPLFTGAPPCPNATRAIGGGAGPLVAVPEGNQDYITYSSHPVDETLSAASTVNGDIAKAWATAVGIQNVGSAPRFFSICSAASDGKVRSRAFTVAANTGLGSDTVTCPNGTRALSGGIGTDAPLDSGSDRLEYTAPLDASGDVGTTGDGDIARRWLSATRNNTDAERTFRVFAICAASEPRPDAHLKRSSDAAFVGQDVYSPVAQVREWSAKRGQTRSFNLRFENDGDVDTFTVRGCASRPTMKVTYINPDTGSVVSGKVTGDGYVLSNLAHAARRSLVVRLQPTSSATIGSELSCRVTATSADDDDVVDAVTARLEVVKA